MAERSSTACLQVAAGLSRRWKYSTRMRSANAFTRWAAPVLVVCAIAAAPAGLRAANASPQQSPASLQQALTAFEAKDFTRAAILARVVGDRETGLARESARYLEGLSQFHSGNLDAAAETLRTAAASTDRFVAGQANVTLGSVEIERKRFDAAAHAYRRAAGFLDAAEAKRARLIAARCFDAAGQGLLADSERAAAGEPRPATAPSAAQPEPAAAPQAARPRTVTADDKPVAGAATEASADSPAPAIAPIRFAIQAGAFRSSASAGDLAKRLEASCRDFKIATPRVIATEDSKGSLFVVQFGDFPNRGAATKMLLKFPRSAYRVERRLDDALTQADSP